MRATKIGPSTLSDLYAVVKRVNEAFDHALVDPGSLSNLGGESGAPRVRVVVLIGAAHS